MLYFCLRRHASVYSYILFQNDLFSYQESFFILSLVKMSSLDKNRHLKYLDYANFKTLTNFKNCVYLNVIWLILQIMGGMLRAAFLVFSKTNMTFQVKKIHHPCYRY